MMRRLNKKGGWADHALEFGLAIFVALVLLLFVRMYLWEGPSSNIASAQSCGSLTGSRGTCATSCDANTEMTFENMGCGTKTKCCVLIDENIRDVILPAPFGGNSDYSFDVTSIGLADPRTCKYETLPDGSENKKTLLCKPRYSYRLTVNIGVVNTGANEVKVSGVPVVVVSGNADSVKPVGTFVSKEPQPLSAQGATATVDVEIAISSTESAEGNYITIYPYAKCETRQCKRADEKSRGILAKAPDDSSEFITIKFVAPTTNI